MNGRSDTPARLDRQRERSNLWTLRLMRGSRSPPAGARAPRAAPGRAVLPAVHATARRESARYLARVLGRPARWADVYRHIHSFAATVLDRVYFLQDRFDQFDLRHSAARGDGRPLARGEGAMLVGAHIGSFEALRALGRGNGVARRDADVRGQRAR